jgi:hypothetical protein
MTTYGDIRISTLALVLALSGCQGVLASSRDGGDLPGIDSGSVVPPRDGGGTTTDAGTTLPPTDGGSNPPPMDGGSNPPPNDTGVTPPPSDTGVTPPPNDTGTPLRDSGPRRDAGPPGPLVPRPAGMYFGANFWNIGWEGWENYFQAGVNWSTTTDPWRPELISDLQQYARVLRFMDWGPTNNAAIVSWSQRIQKTDNQYTAELPTSRGGQAGSERGVAYEWQIDLANRVGADLWITIPHTVNDDFIRQLARLVKGNLRSDLRVYVEFSNETWNWGFQQTQWCSDGFATSGLPGTLTYMGKTVYTDPQVAYCTYRALGALAIWEDEWSDQPGRVVKVLGNWTGYSNWPAYVATWGDVHPITIQQMAMMHDATYNPSNVHIDAYAVAPYFDGNSVGELQGAAAGVINNVRTSHAALALEGSGIPLICYEGGQQGAGGSNQTAVARDPAMYGFLQGVYDQLDLYLDGPMTFYTHTGWQEGQWAWGLKPRTTGNAANELYKWNATIDWVNAHGR